MTSRKKIFSERKQFVLSGDSTSGSTQSESNTISPCESNRTNSYSQVSPVPHASQHQITDNVDSSTGFILKVVLIGDSGVGKSNLVMRFTKNKYNPKSEQTVGFEFATKTIRVGERRMKVQIWDTAGQARFQSLTAAYYRNAVAAMIVYDITDRSTFDHVPTWLEQIQEHCHESLVLVLVGNKCDVSHQPQSREVSTFEAARFASQHGMEFIETSALDSTHVVDAFKKLVVPIGRLLSPTNRSGNKAKVEKLPSGWRRVLSRSRAGEYSYENQYTKERISFAPSEAAKPSQQSFRAAVGLTNGPRATITKENLLLQHQRAFLAQNQSQQCGVCSAFEGCVVM